MALNKSMVKRMKANLSPQALPISKKQDGFNMLNRTGEFGVANSNNPKRKSAGPTVQPTNTARQGKGSVNVPKPSRKADTVGQPPVTNPPRNNRGGNAGPSNPSNKAPMGKSLYKGVD